MTVTPAMVAREAREWLNMPWRHQGYHKGLGCDCIGLVRGVGEATKALIVDPAAPRAKPYAGYSRYPNPALMKQALFDYFTPIQKSEAGIGDILWFRIDKDPMHLGIITEPRVMIHADARIGRVVEHRMDEVWRARIVRAFRFPHMEVSD